MTTRIDDEYLSNLGIELPDPSPPGANYIPFVRTGNLVFLTGQLSILDDEHRYIGKLDHEVTIEEGQLAARLCALKLLANLRVALDGDLDRVVRCVRVGGFVNSVPAFSHQSRVIDGASDLFEQVFGEPGLHTRIAVGVNALPKQAAVEVEAVFEVE